MKEKIDSLFKGIYDWKVSNGKAEPPKHHFPKFVKERADYFWEMAEDGLTFMGAMECIFADEKPNDYDFFATKDWLPKSTEFTEWSKTSLSMAQSEIAIYLLYGNWTDVPEGQIELDLENKLDFNQEIKNIYSGIVQASEKFNFDPQKDEFTIIQPYQEGQAITVRVEDNDERQIKIDVSQATYILPEKEGTLDIYQTEDAE